MRVRLCISVCTYACVNEKECGVNDLSHEGCSGGGEAHSAVHRDWGGLP